MIGQIRKLQVEPDALIANCNSLLMQGGQLHMVWGWFPTPDRIEVCYLVSETTASAAFAVWHCEPVNRVLPSLAALAPSLSWHEREISDLCGVRFDGHPKPFPLVLHEGVQSVHPPLDPRYPASEPVTFSRHPARVPDVVGEDIQELPFGPVRADVLESAQFLFFYLGEHILHYQPRLFFKHRGMEQRFAGREPGIGTLLAERVSGVGSVAHALAYCQAVEAAGNCNPPQRARVLRVLLAELERIYNHLHYFGHLADTTTLKVGNAEGKLLEERVKQLNAELAGNRFLRGIIAPGGLRRDLTVPQDFAARCAALQRETQIYLRTLAETYSYLDRLLTTGELSRQTALEQGATGPVARASGVNTDLRRDHPYAGYDQFEMPVALREAGDANARAEVRALELEASFALVQRLLVSLPEGPVHGDCLPAAGEGIGWSESPRGALFYAVHLDRDGKLLRVKIRSPSFANWRVFQYTVRDTNMMDYAINEASFGLTIAGCDR